MKAGRFRRTSSCPQRSPSPASAARSTGGHPQLAQFFLSQPGGRWAGASLFLPQAMQLLGATWPGNACQLQNIVERA